MFPCTEVQGFLSSSEVRGILLWPSRDCFHQGPPEYSHFLHKYLVIFFLLKMEVAKAQKKPCACEIECLAGILR